LDTSSLIKRHISRAKLAKRLGVTSWSIHRWEDKNGFPRPVRIGKRDYYLEEEVQRYLTRREGGEGHE
jgi:predicted DNA-binding transcriptional regulator AlpA